MKPDNYLFFQEDIVLLWYIIYSKWRWLSKYFSGNGFAWSDWGKKYIYRWNIEYLEAWRYNLIRVHVLQQLIHQAMRYHSFYSLQILAVVVFTCYIL